MRHSRFVLAFKGHPKETELNSLFCSLSEDGTDKAHINAQISAILNTGVTLEEARIGLLRAIMELRNAWIVARTGGWDRKPAHMWGSDKDDLSVLVKNFNNDPRNTWLNIQENMTGFQGTLARDKKKGARAAFKIFNKFPTTK